jgi:para-nitrobenzyl esterase
MSFGLRLAVCSLFLAASLQPVSAETASASKVKTAFGDVSGQNDAASSVTAFKGIPYAAPPVGDLRWREPAAPAAWAGVRQAGTFSASCMQSLHGDFLPWTKEFMVQNQAS